MSLDCGGGDIDGVDFRGLMMGDLGRSILEWVLGSRYFGLFLASLLTRRSRWVGSEAT